MAVFALAMPPRNNIMMDIAAPPTKVLDAQKVPSTRVMDGATTVTRAALSALITPVNALAANTAPTKSTARNANATTPMMVTSASSQPNAVQANMSPLEIPVAHALLIAMSARILQASAPDRKSVV